MRTLIFTLSIIIIFSSCKTYLKATGNYKEPKYETREAVKEYVSTYKGAYDGLFVCNSKEKLKFVTDSVNGSIPFIMVFDKDFRYLYTNKECPWQNASELDSLQNTAVWKYSDIINFSKLNESIQCIDGKKFEPGYRYYVVYFWAKFIPKLSQKMITQVGELTQAKRGDVYIGAINLDLQEAW